MNDSSNYRTRPLPSWKLPEVPSLFEMGTESAAPIEEQQKMDNPKEATRIVERLNAIVQDHKRGSKQINIDLGVDDVRSVVGALKVEEPSNILFTTQKGHDSVKYDAMTASFWLECLELFELRYCATG